ncbi:MAG: Hsp70 family protein [Pirellulales bacterium]|nr:Hsp70 family protein [Pirellulales bacterium]
MGSIQSDANLVGIDLGTTMSVIARLEPNGTTMTIPNSLGDPLTPSIVYFDGSTALVGRMAKEAAALDSSKAALFVKRDMGSPFYSRTVAGRRFRPETLAAIVLRKLKQDAEKRIGPISKAVITVPAFFDDTRRKATEDAGRIAGFEVLDVLNEPTAAALAYAMQSQREAHATDHWLDVPGGEMKAVVYDLGGGTFDVTVVRLRSKHFETVATDGAVRLGGKDWDDRIVDYLGRQFAEKFGVNPAEDPKRRDVWTPLAERYKVILSQLQSVPVELNHQGHSLNLTLTREQFEEATADLLLQTRMVTDLVVTRQAQLGWGDIDRILLVGGSTRMPMVKNMLREVTGQAADDHLDADQVVAQGAAIHAGIIAAKGREGELEIADGLREELEDVAVINVNSHSLGVKALNEDGQSINAVLIPKNTQLPYAASKVFRLRTPGATSIRVNILEGEAAEAAYNIPIGECHIRQLPPNLPRHAPIQVRLAYGANGRVGVMALDMTNGLFAESEIVCGERLSNEELERERMFVDSLNIP